MSKGKDFWGPATWRMIHCFCASYSPKNKSCVKTFLTSIQEMLPCDECSKHMKANLEKIVVDDYLDDNHSLFLWSYMFHDQVNKQLGKFFTAIRNDKNFLL